MVDNITELEGPYFNAQYHIPLALSPTSRPTKDPLSVALMALVD